MKQASVRLGSGLEEFDHGEREAIALALLPGMLSTAVHWDQSRVAMPLLSKIGFYHASQAASRQRSSKMVSWLKSTAQRVTRNGSASPTGIEAAGLK